MALGYAAAVIITVTAVFGSLAILAVILRLYCRVRVQKIALGPDDWLMILALVLSTMINILSDYVTATTGVGDPGYVPDLDAVIFALKCNFGAQDANIVTICLAKVSILLFYRRIFIQPWFKRLNTVVITLVIVFSLSIVLTVTFSKWPVYEQWNPAVPYNVDNASVLISFLTLNVTFDLVTLALPLIALRELQVDWHRKLYLVVIFTLGSFCVVTSILRLVYAVEYTHIVPSAQSLFEAPFILNMLWANIEQPVFIICGCILSFGPLLKELRGKLRRWSSWLPTLFRRAKERSTPENHFVQDIEGANKAGNKIKKTTSVSCVVSPDEGEELQISGRF